MARFIKSQIRGLFRANPVIRFWQGVPGFYQGRRLQIGPALCDPHLAGRGFSSDSNEIPLCPAGWLAHINVCQRLNRFPKMNLRL
jgi:hypothetical protein